MRLLNILKVGNTLLLQRYGRENYLAQAARLQVCHINTRIKLPISKHPVTYYNVQIFQQFHYIYEPNMRRYRIVSPVRVLPES